MVMTITTPQIEIVIRLYCCSTTSIIFSNTLITTAALHYHPYHHLLLLLLTLPLLLPLLDYYLVYAARMITENETLPSAI